MITLVRAAQDLDNLKLADITSGVALAEYELEYLVLEGHAKDLTTGINVLLLL